jgi:hypothetical protein
MSRKMEGAIKNQHPRTIYKPGKRREKRQQTKHKKNYTNNAQTAWTPNGKGVNPGIQEK